MLIRSAAVLVTTLLASLIGISTAAASPRSATTSPRDIDPYCAFSYFSLPTGDGIRVWCDDAGGPFRVTVTCADLTDSWFAEGTTGFPGGRPSRAECVTGLPLGAHITDWSISEE